MRLVTGISIVSLVISVITLALVLMLFVTKEAPESVDSYITRHLLYEYIGRSAPYAYHETGSPSWACLMASSVVKITEDSPRTRYPTYADGIWTFKASGESCEGVETWTVNAETGELKHFNKYGEEIDENTEPESPDVPQAPVKLEPEIPEEDRLANCKTAGELVYDRYWTRTPGNLHHSVLMRFASKNKCSWKDMGLTNR